MSWRAVCAAVAAAVLGACATVPTTGSDGRSLEQRREVLAGVAAWSMRGRLVVDSGDRGFQGSFNWRQRGDELELVVRGPLRNGVLRVEGRPDALTVTARGETHVLSDPEAELSELIGWWLPVASLPDWLLGLPDRDFRAVTVPGADGTLAALEQREWRADYTEYGLTALDGAATEVLVPRRVELTHAALALTLTIDEWQPIDAAP
jgi:outer membrane lipoprotein LolB